MAYDPTLPTARDRMRFTLGDISADPLRTDATYDALLAQFDEPTATALLAESLASEYAQNPSSVNVGGVSVSYSSLVSQWQTVAKRIRDSHVSTGVAEFSDGQVTRVDGQTVEPEYRRSLDDIFRDDYRGPIW